MPSRGEVRERRKAVKRYSVILADPPWDYNDKCTSGKRGAGFKYATMSVARLHELQVASLAAPDCALFLWATMPMLPEAMSVMRSWGFQYKTVAFTWIKRTVNDKLFWGMGNWTRSNPEVVLLGVRGKPWRVSKAVHSVVEAKVREHSRKPDIVRERIVELFGDVPRLEMFARPPVAAGWDAHGNEIEDGVEIPVVRLSDVLKHAHSSAPPLH